MKRLKDRWIKIPTLGSTEEKSEANNDVKEEEEMSFVQKHKKGLAIGALALLTGGAGLLIYNKLKNKDDYDDYEDDFEEEEDSDEE